ncbi:MAG: hypothetical protein EAZ51_03035 [Sphingobacteriales bacterium]|nr:MAG: hypothetical protein EAZ64_07615 [Sphingobacteriales bacterium]TAF82224.1 MAG: hypothetical protein EAZ51_03035 [Sphingobacteriales bacterium]
MKKISALLLLGIVLIFTGTVYFRNFYVFGEGVKSGELNYLVKKGNIFKTFEGKLIQNGFKSKNVGTLQSYDFEFSVVNNKIANSLMQNSGKYFDLHYKEYHHALAWRGYSVYVVDSVYAMRNTPDGANLWK